MKINEKDYIQEVMEGREPIVVLRDPEGNPHDVYIINGPISSMPGWSVFNLAPAIIRPLLCEIERLRTLDSRVESQAN